MPRIVTIASSPAQHSRSAAMLEHAGALLAQRGLSSSNISVRELPPEDLLFGRPGNPVIQRASELIQEADGLIVATPVYKAAYSGLLKLFFDLLPQTALAGKVVLPIATGGSPAHLLAINYALKPVLAALGAEHILGGVYVVDSQLRSVGEQGYELDEDVRERLERSLDGLARALAPASAPAALAALPLVAAR
jgi:FMN reductase